MKGREAAKGADRLLRVVIIEDVREVREGLATLIGGTHGFAVVGAYSSMEEALERFDAAAPDVALVDIGLPGMSGIEGIQFLKKSRFKELPILALTVHDGNDRVFDALCAGASGYLLKNTPPARLLEAILEVTAGGAPMSQEVARRVIDLFRQFRPAARASYDLTPQERQLLKLLVEGHHYKTAANALSISVNTVSFHLRNVYFKLQVHSKTEAVAKALRENLF
jgi:DNA-binding NarL/FixJ family response regulator